MKLIIFTLFCIQLHAATFRPATFQTIFEKKERKAINDAAILSYFDPAFAKRILPESAEPSLVSIFANEDKLNLKDFLLTLDIFLKPVVSFGFLNSPDLNPKLKNEMFFLHFYKNIPDNSIIWSSEIFNNYLIEKISTGRAPKELVAKFISQILSRGSIENKKRLVEQVKLNPVIFTLKLDEDQNIPIHLLSFYGSELNQVILKFEEPKNGVCATLLAKFLKR